MNYMTRHDTIMRLGIPFQRLSHESLINENINSIQIQFNRFPSFPCALAWQQQAVPSCHSSIMA